MRLAVLADIHGNVAALEAVIADMAGRGVDGVVDLGDCVSGPLWPTETLALLRTKDWPTVRGNHDRWVGEGTAEPAYHADAFARAALDAAGRRWLAALPTRLTIRPQITAFHGRPDDDDAYLLEDVVGGRLMPARASDVAARLGGVEARIVLCAHSHLAAVLRLPDGRWIVNPGSVGCPAYADPTPPAHVSESGTPAARYAILDIGEVRPDAPALALIVIPYDHAAAARRALACDRPDWAAALSSGYADVT